MRLISAIDVLLSINKMKILYTNTSYFPICVSIRNRNKKYTWKASGIKYVFIFFDYFCECIYSISWEIPWTYKRVYIYIYIYIYIIYIYNIYIIAIKRFDVETVSGKLLPKWVAHSAMQIVFLCTGRNSERGTRNLQEEWEGTKGFPRFSRWTLLKNNHVITSSATSQLNYRINGKQVDYRVVTNVTIMTFNFPHVFFPLFHNKYSAI